MIDLTKDPFAEYYRQSEPDMRYKAYAWRTGIGLQAADGLRPSEYLLETAKRSIDGEISHIEAEELLDAYYRARPSSAASDRTEEADKVSARIAALLCEDAFSLTPNKYLSIHRRLFQGIYDHAGRIRRYNVSKKEWVLDGASVHYGSASELRATLDYDISEERKFSYRGLTLETVQKLLGILPKICYNEIRI